MSCRHPGGRSDPGLPARVPGLAGPRASRAWPAGSPRPHHAQGASDPTDGRPDRRPALTRGTRVGYSRRVSSPERPTSVRPVEYRGEPLDAQRGPGLGCFRFQVAVLVVLVVLTPLSVAWVWPPEVSAALLGLTILLLLVAGQTIIFLLRLVAADRREGRPRPLASPTRTVGELEDERDGASRAAPADRAAGEDPAAAPGPGTAPRDGASATPPEEPPPAPGVRE
jgi:hypothetical protein